MNDIEKIAAIDPSKPISIEKAPEGAIGFVWIFSKIDRDGPIATATGTKKVPTIFYLRGGFVLAINRSGEATHSCGLGYIGEWSEVSQKHFKPSRLGGYWPTVEQAIGIEHAVEVAIS